MGLKRRPLYHQCRGTPHDIISAAYSSFKEWNPDPNIYVCANFRVHQGLLMKISADHRRSSVY
jgi:hypothetical protein